MKYNVKTFRDAGLEAKWGRTHRNAPIILARYPDAKLPHQRETWWVVDRNMWHSMIEQGIREAFDSYTMLGDVFYV